jgi:hypothetical protein
MIRILTEMSPLSAPEMTDEQAEAYGRYYRLNGLTQHAMTEVIDHVNQLLSLNFILFGVNGNSLFIDYPEINLLSAPGSMCSVQRMASFVFLNRKGRLPTCFQQPYITFPSKTGVVMLEDDSLLGSLYFDLDSREYLRSRLLRVLREMARYAGIDFPRYEVLEMEAIELDVRYRLA